MRLNLRVYLAGFLAAFVIFLATGEAANAAIPQAQLDQRWEASRLLFEAVTDTLPLSFSLFPPKAAQAISATVRVGSLAKGAAAAPPVDTNATATLPPDGPVARALPTDYNVLGSIAIKVGRVPNLDKWRHITRADYSWLYIDDCPPTARACASAFARTMRAAVATARERHGMDRLAYINRSVNRAIAYKSDRALWGVSDYWATPEEIALKGAGDCEDYAIAKLWALRSLGFPPQSLQLILIDDTRTRAYHAVLGVHLEGRTYILDSLTDTVAADAAFPRYMPIMSFVADAGYIHGFKSGDRRAYASLTPKLDAVAPGEAE